MLPVTLPLGWFSIQTGDLFLALGLFLGIFVYWRRIKYDSGYSESEAMDGFLQSLLGGYLIGRLVYVLLNLNNFGLKPLAWINIFAYPGFNQIVALIVSAILMRKWAEKNKFEPYIMLDYWATAAAFALFIYEIGAFLTGTGYGYETKLPWGFVFPGLVVPHHPANLYAAFFYLGLFIYLNWAEYNYRTFDWYRYGKNTAESGFIFAVFGIMLGVFGIISNLWRADRILVTGIPLESTVWGVIIIFSGLLLFYRSGRRFIKKKKKKPVLLETEKEDKDEVISLEIEEKVLTEQKSRLRPTVAKIAATKVVANKAARVVPDLKVGPISGVNAGIRKIDLVSSQPISRPPAKKTIAKANEPTLKVRRIELNDKQKGKK